MKLIIILFVLLPISNAYSQEITKEDWDTFFKYSVEWKEVISYSGNNENHKLWFTFNDSLTFELFVGTLQVLFNDFTAPTNEGFYYKGANYYARIPEYFCVGCKMLISYWCEGCYISNLEYFKSMYYDKKLH